MIRCNLILLSLAIVLIPAIAICQNFREAKVGDQIWMAENLSVSQFRNGDPIPAANTPEEWKKAGEEGKPAWCYYNNDSANAAKYGKLYNWYAIKDKRGLAPTGWHVAADEDWAILESLAGVEPGKKIKSLTDWNDNGNGTNETGFSAFPGGIRDDFGNCAYMGEQGYWWTSTDNDRKNAWIRILFNSFNNVIRVNLPKQSGLSVRCIRD